jgi:4-amino-4-deoxy-L-arabinose transferase-like glycosyltransferase
MLTRTRAARSAPDLKERHVPQTRSAATAPPTRLQVWAWLGIVAVLVLLALRAWSEFQLGTDHDDAVYVVLARSLISSDTYGLINGPGPPLPERYPFGYPLLLSLVMRLFPDNLDALKAPSLVATVLNTALLFWGWRYLGGSSRWWGLAVTALYALSSLTISHATRVMSEPIFTTGCLAALLLTQWRAARSDVGWWWWVTMSLALAVALFTRTIGIILVGTVAVYLLIRVGRPVIKEFVGVALGIGVVVALVVATTPVAPRDLLPTGYLRDSNAVVLVGVQNGGSAIDDQPPPSQAVAPSARGSLGDLMVSNVRFYLVRGIRSVATELGGGDEEQPLADRLGVPYLPVGPGLAVSALVAFGFARSVSQGGGPPFAWFALAYLPIFVVWAGRDVRLLYPISPQLHWAVLAGFESLAWWLVTRVPSLQAARLLARIALVGVAISLIGSFAYRSARPDDSRSHAGDLALRTQWVSANTSTNAVVMSEAPEADFLYGGRRTVAYPSDSSSPERLEAYARQSKVTHVLVAPAVEWQTVYRAHYSPATAALLGAMNGLVSEGGAELIYRSEDGTIQVFRMMSESSNSA